MFTALVLTEQNGTVTPSIQQLDDSLLLEGDVTVAVEYSTLNYKDGMVVNGLGRLVRRYPHVPGVDFAGTVEASNHPNFAVGDRVILTGWRVGELHWGGYATRARVKGDWLVKTPEALSNRQTMALGSAGLSAMLALMTLEEHGLRPDAGEVLVTGAAGGVGSVAVALLAQHGYKVAASTGRPETHDYLRGLGASTLIDRQELATPGTRPLESERWVACIDNVGGTTLAHVISQMRHSGSIAAIGLAGGDRVDTSVMPFLLRAINLLGIDSVQCPIDRRYTAWNRLAAEMPLNLLETITQDITLADVPRLAGDILKGQIRGRAVVDVRG